MHVFHGILEFFEFLSMAFQTTNHTRFPFLFAVLSYFYHQPLFMIPIGYGHGFKWFT